CWVKGRRLKPAAPELDDIGIAKPCERRSWLAATGFMAGLLALPLAVSAPHVAAALTPPPPTPGKVLSTWAKTRAKLAVRWLLRSPSTPAPLPASPPGKRWLFNLTVAATTLGLVGALAGTGG